MIDQPIKGRSDYRLTDAGVVSYKRIDRPKTLTPKITKKANGSVIATLVLAGKRTRKTVNVAELYLLEVYGEKKPEGTIAVFKDGNHNNVKHENLLWTKSYMVDERKTTCNPNYLCIFAAKYICRQVIQGIVEADLNKAIKGALPNDFAEYSPQMISFGYTEAMRYLASKAGQDFMRTLTATNTIRRYQCEAVIWAMYDTFVKVYDYIAKKDYSDCIQNKEAIQLFIKMPYIQGIKGIEDFLNKKIIYYEKG